MADSTSKVWITWERQRRSIVLAEHFRARLFIYEKEFRSRLLRYLAASLHTIRWLAGHRPDTVFAQNPSLILALLLCFIRPLFGFRLIIDRHSNFMLGVEGGVTKKLFAMISNLTLRLADLTIVTNHHLKELVESNGGKGIVLQDKLPAFSCRNRTGLKGGFNVVFTTSFSGDEPIAEVISAYAGIGHGITLYITGNYRKYPDYVKYVGPAYENIVFTGFLPEGEYQELLFSADAVLCLTRNDHTLTCGAYEGLALGKPMILSNTGAIREYFRKGAVYADASQESIKSATLACLATYDRLATEAVLLRSQVEEDWNGRCSLVMDEIEALRGTV
jgi:glycosyltransferase involved in cell wall biosynthesis